MQKFLTRSGEKEVRKRREVPEGWGWGGGGGAGVGDGVGEALRIQRDGATSLEQPIEINCSRGSRSCQSQLPEPLGKKKLISSRISAAREEGKTELLVPKALKS